MPQKLKYFLTPRLFERIGAPEAPQMKSPNVPRKGSTWERAVLRAPQRRGSKMGREWPRSGSRGLENGVSGVFGLPWVYLGPLWSILGAPESGGSLRAL